MFHQRFKTANERFAEKFDVLPSGCWQWKGKDKGYPKFWTGAGYVRASRLALEKHLGKELAPNELACHHCDNVRCVNPAHLFASTQTGNMQDRAAKRRGRHPVGVANGRALLDEETVLRIRRMYAQGKASQDALALMFGVKQTTVSHIVRRDTWKHINDEPTVQA